VSPALASAVGRTGLKGVMIIGVQPGSVAERGGLVQGDVVVGFGSTPIVSLADLTGAVAGVAPGATVIAHVVRAGKDQEVSLQF
jgi:serine protease Do